MAARAENYSLRIIPAWFPVFLLLAGVAVVLLALSNFNPHLVLHLILFTAGLAVTYAISPREDVRTLVSAYVVGYVVRVAAVLLVHHLVSGGLAFYDDWNYDEQARYLASDWSLSSLAYAASDLGTAHTGYPILLGSLYGLFGPSLISAKFLNVFFGALTAPIAYLLGVEISGERTVGRAVTWLTSLFLYDAMWAGFLMKDTILLFLFTATVLFLVRFAKTRQLRMLLVAVGLLLLVQFFRFYSVAVIVLAASAGLTLSASRHRMLSSRTARMAAGLALAIAAVALWFLLVGYAETIDAVAMYAKALDQFDASGYTLLRFAPNLAFLQQLMKAVLVYQLGPYPWVFSGVDFTGILFYPGMYLIYALLPFFFIGFTKLGRKLDGPRMFVLAALVLHAAVEVFMYQSGERQRMMVDVLFVVCAAVGWSGRAGKARLIVGTYAALLVFAVFHISGRLF